MYNTLILFDSDLGKEKARETMKEAIADFCCEDRCMDLRVVELCFCLFDSPLICTLIPSKKQTKIGRDGLLGRGQE